MREAETTLAAELDLIRRGYELRKARKIGILLADCGQMYVCDSAEDPWGTKRRLSWDAFRALVEEAEARPDGPARKTAGAESAAERCEDAA